MNKVMFAFVGAAILMSVAYFALIQSLAGGADKGTIVLLSYVVLAASFLVAVGFYYYFKVRILDRINKARLVISNLADYDLGTELEVTGNDEISGLLWKLQTKLPTGRRHLHAIAGIAI